MPGVINVYNDIPLNALDGFGIDISTQRADDLDNELLALIKANNGNVLRVLDLGCGMGGQTLRMAALGCHVTSVDALDFSMVITHGCNQLNIPVEKVQFINADIRNTGGYLHGEYHYIYSQRAVHYLPYIEAKQLLTELREHLRKGFESKLFISVSGLHSELGQGYIGSPNIDARFSYLHSTMAEKHKIEQPVCLYTLEDLNTLLLNCGYKIEKIYTSLFGNIISIAVL